MASASSSGHHRRRWPRRSTNDMDLRRRELPAAWRGGRRRSDDAANFPDQQGRQSQRRDGAGQALRRRGRRGRRGVRSRSSPIRRPRRDVARARPRRMATAQGRRPRDQLLARERRGRLGTGAVVDHSGAVQPRAAGGQRDQFRPQENKADGRKRKEKAEGKQRENGRIAESGGRNSKDDLIVISMVYSSESTDLPILAPPIRPARRHPRRLAGPEDDLKPPTRPAL